MRKPIVAGNWKLHGSMQFVSQLSLAVVDLAPIDIDVILCPTSVHLSQVASITESHQHISVGAQDVSAHSQGAYTGEVSAEMIKECGCQYALVGHSERRQYHGETDKQCAFKIEALLNNDITPIYCVGESLQQREAGETNDVVEKQILAVLEKISVNGLSRCIIAYEPVWAIGTGKTASPEQAQEVHAHIRMMLAEKDKEMSANMQILYGGSVKADNAMILFSQPDIDGGLIGGASLLADDFLAICHAASKQNVA